MFLDQAEFRDQRRRDIRMRDWALFLDFLPQTHADTVKRVPKIEKTIHGARCRVHGKK
jgi:hypothetical protein